MPTTKEYHNLVLKKLEQTPFTITSRPMMGGYLLYADGVLFGGFYGGDRFLVKITETNAGFGLPGGIPYEGSKTTMYQNEELEDMKKVAEIIEATLEGLRKQ